ncbi:MAG: hypothetical protein OSJ43_15675 [Oscillospiraceae bacterium]|nr:hypothetical protein [Oscillospiraceae bacterium]
MQRRFANSAKTAQISARTARKYSYPTFAERPHKSRDSRLKIGHG